MRSLDIQVCSLSEVEGRITKSMSQGAPFDGVLSLIDPPEADAQLFATTRHLDEDDDRFADIEEKFSRAPPWLKWHIPQNWHGCHKVICCYDIEFPDHLLPTPNDRVVTTALAFLQNMKAALNGEAEERGPRILVHCEHGIGRSPSVGLVMMCAQTSNAFVGRRGSEILQQRPLAEFNRPILEAGTRLLKLPALLNILERPDVAERREGRNSVLKAHGFF